MMLLSIITVNYNNLEGLRTTISSVLSQTFSDIEFIVIDGNSTDGSVEYLRTFSDVIHWISEPDLGIYDAMNKGIRMASGVYLYFLNGGDVLYDEYTLSHVIELLETKNPSLLYGDTSVVNGLMREIGYIDNSSIDALSILITAVNHQSIILEKSLFERFGNYDIGFRIKADHDWFLRVYRKRMQLVLVYTNRPLVKYLAGGFSDNARSKYVSGERKEIVRRHASIHGRVIYTLLSGLFRLKRGSASRKICNLIILKA